MDIEKINIEKFLALAKNSPVIDVRSPKEFKHAYIPGAYSSPLFTDEERKIVGTTYKHQSREAAIKIGLDFFGVKMKPIIEEVEQLKSKTVLVHCWRGGMRSTAIAWLLDLYGFKVYTLNGGYKTFRNWVLLQFNNNYKFKILGGYTGSGKTNVLHKLSKQNKAVIDLEAIANHKGSAFGALGQTLQPTQEMFENTLALKLLSQRSAEIWIEDESQRIGKCMIPNNIWEQMRQSKIFFLDIPFEERLKYLVDEYGKFDKESLENSIMRIQKRLGGLETKNAISHLLENNISDCFSILLKYYDKLYSKGLQNRENYESLLNIIPCLSVNADINVNKLS